MRQKVTIFDLQAELCTAMGNPVRVQIVHLLREGPKRVSSIAEELNISQTNISRHLAVLRKAGILSSQRQGTDMMYRISNPKITEICESMRNVLCERESQRSEIFQNLKK